MKKRISALLLTLLLAAALLIPVFASDASDESDDRIYIQDLVGILSQEEQSQLEERAQSIAQQFQFAVNIIVIPDYMEYNTASVYEAAKTIYKDYNLGYGPEQDGVLLLLSMNDRDYANIAYGYGNVAFTDYGKERQEAQFLDDFRDDDWYDGFSDYLAVSERYLQLAREGTPFDVDSEPRQISPIVRLGVGVVLPIVIAALAVLSMRSQLKSVAMARGAEDYIIAPEVELHVREDVYTHTTRTERKIERSERSGGGGTSVDSDGFSGSSGKF